MAQNLSPEVLKMNDAFEHDEAQFRAKIPYELTSTPLKGVYLNPTPPEDFDPETASAHELIKNGIMVRRPTKEDPPELQAAWSHFFARKWLAKDRIVPEFAPNIGKTHILRQPAVQVQEGESTSYYSNAWAGAVTQTGSWTLCTANWTIPTVSKPSEAQGTEGGWNSSSWVGIDGFNSNLVSSNDVVQAGVEQKVDKNGNASYFAWYEWYAPAVKGSPAYIYEVPIPNMPASPGQVVSVSVQYVSTSAVTITFVNMTTNTHFAITLAPPPGANFNGKTVEWIMEAPDQGEPISSLPKFTPVVFTSAIACGTNNTNTQAGLADTVNIRNSANKVLSSTTTGTDTATVSFIG